MFKNLRNIFTVILLVITVLAGSAIITTGVAGATTLGPTHCKPDKDSPGACSVDLPQEVVSTGTTKAIMKIVFGITGVLSVVFIAIGGFKYTVSGGDPAGLTSAKNTITYALVGLGVSISAFILVQFVIGSV